MSSFASKFKVSISAFLDPGSVPEDADATAKKAGEKFRKAFNAAGVAAGAALSKGLIDAINMDSAQAKVSASLGLSQKESEKIGKISGSLYSQAYGESMEEVSNAVATTQKTLKGMNNASDAALRESAKNALNYASVFDTDVSDAINKANILINSGLAKDSTEAFNLMIKSSQKVGPALTGDILDASEEYAQFFDQLGISSTQAFGILTTNADKGVYGIDKAGDAIKEFGIRATDGSAATTKLLNELTGGQAANFSNDLLKGGEDARVATQKIAQGLLAIKNPTEQAAAAITLFGTPLEDLGVRNIPKFLEALSSAQGGLQGVDGAVDKLDKTLSDTAGNNLEEMKRQLQLAFVQVAGEALPVITAITDAINKHPKIFKAVAIAAAAVATAVVATNVAMKVYAATTAIIQGATKAWAAIQWVLNSALLANPITWIVLGIIALIAVIVLIATKTTWFQDIWEVVWDAIKSVAENFVIGLKAIWNTMAGFFTAIWEGIKTVFLTAFEVLKTVITTYLNIYKTIFTTAFNAVKLVFTTVWNAISTAFTTVINTIKMTFSAAWTWITQKANALVDTFLSVKERIAGAFTGIFDGLKNAFKAAYNFIADAWNGINFTIPAPSIGGLSVGPDITVDPPNIPRLAEGGITTGPTLAVVGDNPGGREAIIPLNKLSDILKTEGNRKPEQVIINQTVPVQKNMLEYYLTTKSAVRQGQFT